MNWLVIKICLLHNLCLHTTETKYWQCRPVLDTYKHTISNHGNTAAGIIKQHWLHLNMHNTLKNCLSNMLIIIKLQHLWSKTCCSQVGNYQIVAKLIIKPTLVYESSYWNCNVIQQCNTSKYIQYHIFINSIKPT